MSIERRWLAAVIAGTTLPIVDGGVQTDALLACATEEGVVALVHQRLSDDPDVHVSASLRAAFAAAARQSAVAELLRESECRKVLGVLQAARIPVLLMKGSALAWWLYPSAQLRECSDIDLLFASRVDAQKAVELVAAHGYVVKHWPDDLTYELLCRREFGRSHVDLDIHWRLVNAPMFSKAFEFEMLRDASISLPRLSADARGLGPAHAFVHACVHRAMNLAVGIDDGLKWLYDLHLLGQRLDAAEWSALQQHCRKYELSGICVAGIDAAAQAFGAAVPEAVLQSLREASAHEGFDASRLRDWKYVQGRNLIALSSLRLRARWIRQRLFPPVGYLRELYGADRSVASLWMQRALHAIRRVRS